MDCKECGKEFKPNGYSNLCPDCRRRKTPKIYFRIAILIVALSFIGGIILGNTNKVVVSSYDDILEEYEYDKVFNTDLMLECWVGSLLFSILVCGIGSINYRLNLIIDKKGK